MLEGSLTEKGILQLLFDLRFLRHVLIGQPSASDRTSESAASFSDYETRLQARHSRHSPLQVCLSRDHHVPLALQYALIKVRHENGDDLQDKLDPIDWAIYGMYLWQNVATFQQRVRVLFGAMIQPGKSDPEVFYICCPCLTERLPFQVLSPSQGLTVAQVLNKTAPSGEANVLSVAPPASRFAYLPISTPSATSNAARHLLTTGTPPTSANAAANLESPV